MIQKHKAQFIMGALFIIALIVIGVLIGLNNRSDPFDPIIDMRENIEDYKVITTNETESGTLVYSAGEANDGNDNMYFADLVKKTLFGYRWLGGGGHVSHEEAKPGEKLAFSAQFLDKNQNENQNMTPTVFGVLADEQISGVTVQTSGGSFTAALYDGREASEKLYAVQLQNDGSQHQDFVFELTYQDGKQLSFTVLNDEIEAFQQGEPIYFYTQIPAPVQQMTVARPFPQHTSYTQGVIQPNNVSQEQMDNDVRRIYDEWKARYLVQAENQPDQYYVFYNKEQIIEPSNAVSCSEGHGYGMLATVLMAGYDDDAKVYFDGLYRFYKAHPCATDPALMGWQQIKQDNGDIINTPPYDDEDGSISATDGDMDIAYALLLADKQWGSDGEINYIEEAKIMINAIMKNDVNTEKWILKLGSWANDSDPVYGTGTRSSDFMLSHLKAFQAATGDPNWGKVADKTYAIIDSLFREQSPATGLLPDFSFEADGKYVPSGPNYLEVAYDGDYYYNSCRVPWRIPIDYLMSGDSRALTQITALNQWIQASSEQEPSEINAGYRLDGSRIVEEEQNVMVFIAPFAVSAMVDSGNQPWLNALWAHIVSSPTDECTYFDNSVRLLVMITVSGNWWMP